MSHQYPQPTYQSNSQSNYTQQQPYYPPNASTPVYPGYENFNQQQQSYYYSQQTQQSGNVSGNGTSHIQPRQGMTMKDIRGNGYNAPLFKLTRGRKIALLILAAVGIAAAVCFAVFHKDIVNGFEPLKNKVHNSGAPYWLIPIAVLVVLSIPPLFGHELVLLIVGLIWGLGQGFGIASAGTLLGEALTYFLCKHVLRKHALKFEEKNAYYGCIARLMREPGWEGIFYMILARYSILPGHVVTAIQSTIGVGFFKYLIAIVVSLPKQLVFVYLGTVYDQTDNNSSGHNKERRISYIVMAISVVITIIAFGFMRRRAQKYLPEVIAEMQRREAEADTPTRMSPASSGTRVEQTDDIEGKRGGRSKKWF